MADERIGLKLAPAAMPMMSAVSLFTSCDCISYLGSWKCPCCFCKTSKIYVILYEYIPVFKILLHLYKLSKEMCPLYSSYHLCLEKEAQLGKQVKNLL